MIGLEKHPTIFKNSYCPFLAVTKCDVTGLSQWERGWRRARLWLVSSLPSRIRCSPPPKTAEAVPLKKGAISWAQRWPPARPRSNGSLAQLFGEGAKEGKGTASLEAVRVCIKEYMCTQNWSRGRATISAHPRSFKLTGTK